MGVPSISTICGYTIPSVVCIPTPAGGQVCLPTVRLGFQNPMELAIKWLRDWFTSFLPLMPFMVFLKVFADVLLMIKALGSLPDPVPFIQASITLANDIAQITGLLPPLAFPAMLIGLIKALAFYFDSLYNHLNFLIAQLVKITALQALANQLNNASLGGVAQCSLNNFNSRVAALQKSLGTVGLLIGIVKLIFCLAFPGVPLSVIPTIPTLNPASLADALIPVAALRDFFNTLAGVIPTATGSQLSC